MLVTPLPGVDRRQLLTSLQEIMSGAINLRGTSGVDPHRDYIRWANLSAEILSRLVSASDVDRLILTRRYWVLQSSGVNPHEASMQLLLRTEVNDRVRDLEETHAALQAQTDRWSRAGIFVIPDTSFYIEHQEKLEEVDFGSVFKAVGDPIHLLVPILVVDELDGLKRSGDRHTRWRAGYTLAVLDRRLRHPTEYAVLRESDLSAIDQRTGGIPRGEVTLEVVFDPPGHTRLPINDDELIDRAVAVQTFCGRQLRLVTYDTGQSMRSRAAGLETIKLDHAIGEEPERK